MKKVQDADILKKIEPQLKELIKYLNDQSVPYFITIAGEERPVDDQHAHHGILIAAGQDMFCLASCISQCPGIEGEGALEKLLVSYRFMKKRKIEVLE